MSSPITGPKPSDRAARKPGDEAKRAKRGSGYSWQLLAWALMITDAFRTHLTVEEDADAQGAPDPQFAAIRVGDAVSDLAPAPEADEPVLTAADDLPPALPAAEEELSVQPYHPGDFNEDYALSEWTPIAAPQSFVPPAPQMLITSKLFFGRVPLNPNLDFFEGFEDFWAQLGFENGMEDLLDALDPSIGGLVGLALAFSEEALMPVAILGAVDEDPESISFWQGDQFDVDWIVQASGISDMGAPIVSEIHGVAAAEVDQRISEDGGTITNSAVMIDGQDWEGTLWVTGNYYEFNTIVQINLLWDNDTLTLVRIDDTGLSGGSVQGGGNLQHNNAQIVDFNGALAIDEDAFRTEDEYDDNFIWKDEEQEDVDGLTEANAALDSAQAIVDGAAGAEGDDALVTGDVPAPTPTSAPATGGGSGGGGDAFENASPLAEPDPVPAPEPQAAADEEPASEQQAAADEEPEPEQQAAIEEEPAPEQQAAAEDEPAPEPEAVAEEEPAPEQQAAVEEEPAPEQQAAAEEEPAPEQEAAADEEPAPEQQAAAEDEPAPEPEAVAEEEPAPEQQAAVEEEPAPEQQAAAEEEPAPEQQTAAEDEPAPEQQVAVEDEPAPEPQAVVEEEGEAEPPAPGVQADGGEGDDASETVIGDGAIGAAATDDVGDSPAADDPQEPVLPEIDESEIAADAKSLLPDDSPAEEEEPEQQAANEDEPAPEQQEAAEEEPAPEQQAAVEEEPAPEQQAAAEDEPAPEQQATAEEEPAPEQQEAAEEEPAPEQQAAAEEEPAPEQQEAAEEEPAPEQQAAAEEEPAPEQQATAEEEPAPEQQEAAEEEPAPEQQSAAEEEPAPEQQAAVEEEVEPEQQAAVEEEAEPEQQAAVEEEAEPEQQAAAEDEPAPEQQAAVEEEPAPEQQAAVEEEAEPEQQAAVEDEPEPEQQAAVEDEPAPEQQAAVEEESAPEQQAAAEEEPEPEQQAAVEEEAEPEQQAAVEEEPEPEQQAAAEEEPETEQQAEAEEEPAPEPQASSENQSHLATLAQEEAGEQSSGEHEADVVAQSQTTDDEAESEDAAAEEPAPSEPESQLDDMLASLHEKRSEWLNDGYTVDPDDPASVTSGAIKDAVRDGSSQSVEHAARNANFAAPDDDGEPDQLILGDFKENFNAVQFNNMIDLDDITMVVADTYHSLMNMADPVDFASISNGGNTQQNKSVMVGGMNPGAHGMSASEFYEIKKDGPIHHVNGNYYEFNTIFQINIAFDLDEFFGRMNGDEVVGSGGLIQFNEAAIFENDGRDDLFVGGSYTEYNLVMQMNALQDSDTITQLHAIDWTKQPDIDFGSITKHGHDGQDDVQGGVNIQMPGVFDDMTARSLSMDGQV